MNYPKISIVTINLNNARYLEETILSVLNQGYPNLEYIIIDGVSTDGSIDIIKKYESRLAWISEKDQGYGFALQKGFSRATGEIMGWLNSDDIHYPRCLFNVAVAFNKNPQIKWITGFPSWISEIGFRLGEMPNIETSYWASRYDLYLKYSRWSRIRYLGGDFLAIQQESTFWKRDLWKKAGGNINTNYKLAVDTELWSRFFRYEILHTKPSILAGFRWSGGRQLTKLKRKEYHEDCLKVIKEARATLSIVQRINLFLRFYLGKLFKPCFYFGLPFGIIYEKLLAIPPAIHSPKN